MSVTVAELFGRLRRIGGAGSAAFTSPSWTDRLRLSVLISIAVGAAGWLSLVAVIGPAVQSVGTEDVARGGTEAVAEALAAGVRERLTGPREAMARLAHALVPVLSDAAPDMPAQAARLATAMLGAAAPHGVAVFAPDGNAIGEAAPDLQAAARTVLAEARDAGEVGFFPCDDGIAMVRLVRAANGVVRGMVVAALDMTWLDHETASLVRGGTVGRLMLIAPPDIVLYQSGGPPSDPDGAQSSEIAVFPGELNVQVVRQLPNGMAASGGMFAVWILLAGPAAALLLGVVGLLRRRVAGLEVATQRRERRVAELAGASERLSRLRDPIEVAARGEAMVRGLLDCDEARVLLGRAPAEPADDGDAAERQSVNLIAANGERLGRLSVKRSSGQPFSSEEELVLDQVARAVAAALEGANLLADAMNAKSQVELILSTISDGVFMLDRHWCVRYVNNAALRYLQRNQEEMLGATLWELFPGLREAEAGERIEFAIRTAQEVDFSTSYAPLNAWYEMRCYPFAGGLTVYFRDITAQRETEEKLRQSQKLEALGQLTGGIAHDVNNLLTVILGNFEMLAMSAEDRREDGEADLEMAQAGMRAGDSASQLMNRLLAFSRQQPLSPKVLEIGDMLGSLEPLLRRTIGEQITLRITWQKSLWRALVDPVELENAILNLAINARDAMPGGGRLTIEAVNVQIDRVYAAVAGLDRTGDFIMLSVADTGTGMSREVAAKAFDPFFTTKQPGQGTGLGLSMVYGFAKQSGGHVIIDSELGQGTIIRLYMPRSSGSLVLPTLKADRRVTGGNESILLVEDNDMVRAHTEAMLVGLGYAVIAAADGPEAVALLQEGLRPSLLLTDVVLPGGMTGRDVADAAARLVPGLRVLFTSGYSGSVLSENGRLTAGVELIGKPFRRADLAARIRDQLSRAPWAMPAPPLGAEGVLSGERGDLAG